mmetsp:Transcript_80579/g.207392  ORF Transcript_80579/g.207392 Transcript_80579/m.207392 type:complete len:295 (-) Transcript_80579:702-1586(-)
MGPNHCQRHRLRNHDNHVRVVVDNTGKEGHRHHVYHVRVVVDHVQHDPRGDPRLHTHGGERGLLDQQDDHQIWHRRRQEPRCVPGEMQGQRRLRGLHMGRGAWLARNHRRLLAEGAGREGGAHQASQVWRRLWRDVPVQLLERHKLVQRLQRLRLVQRLQRPSCAQRPCRQGAAQRPCGRGLYDDAGHELHHNPADHELHHNAALGGSWKWRTLLLCAHAALWLRAQAAGDAVRAGREPLRLRGLRRLQQQGDQGRWQFDHGRCGQRPEVQEGRRVRHRPELADLPGRLEEGRR